MNTEQGSYAHDSLQPTLIMLANFEKRKRQMTKTVLLMRRQDSTNARRERKIFPRHE